MKRLAYIDWMRGLACVLMFQTHCYDSWLSPAARKSAVLVWSQLGGTFPAPLFIFLAGVSVALVSDRLRERGLPPDAILRQTAWRGAEVFGLGLLFRVQEYLLGYPWSPKTDLLRVDVLNILGLSMMLLALLCRLGSGKTAEAARRRSLVLGLAAAAAVALLTPPLWTTWRPGFLPWPLESYVNGVHVFDAPQAWLFPLFPWSAFAFAGLAVGFFLFSDFARRHQARAFFALGAAGVLAGVLSVVLDHSPIRLYAVYDYWHSGPNFFLLRLGLLLVLLLAGYAWCRWGPGQKGFSPLIQLGNTSLLVYWVHIEFVYGRFSILPKGQSSVLRATLGLAIIFVAMVGLSLLRTGWKGRRTKVSGSPAEVGATAGS